MLGRLVIRTSEKLNLIRFEFGTAKFLHVLFACLWRLNLFFAFITTFISGMFVQHNGIVFHVACLQHKNCITLYQIDLF